MEDDFEVQPEISTNPLPKWGKYSIIESADRHSSLPEENAEWSVILWLM
jgi:hypothetical protein